MSAHRVVRSGCSRYGAWAGRYRLSERARELALAVGRETIVDAGLSTTLLSRSGLVARRLAEPGTPVAKSGSDPLLAGVPDPLDLNAASSVGYAFAPRWSLRSGRQSRPCSDHGGGGSYVASLSYRQPPSERSYWDASLSASLGKLHTCRPLRRS